MPNRTIEKVEVESLTKWGYKDVEGFVNFSKTLSENDRAAVVPGAKFEAEIYMSDPTEKYPQGTRYLNKIVARTAKVEVPKKPAVTDVTPPMDQERTKRFTPKFKKSEAAPTSAGLTKEEWAMKDQRISRQGVIQAAVIALAPVVSLEQLPDEAMKLATQMLEFVNPVSIQ